MSRVLSKADGLLLIGLAREAINAVFEKRDPTIPEKALKRLDDPRGVFVSLHKRGKLRGCIGFPRGSNPLYRSLMTAAKSAAFQDSRFLPLSKEEFEDVDIEVSLLTEPTIIQKEDPGAVLKSFTVGKDGLIIKNEAFAGLLLPHIVPKEGWSSEDFLRFACNKLGLNELAWLDPGSRLYKFRAQVFAEQNYS
ncbi:MAG: AmmeMemoRadiSam system protein A [Nanoarchaeota archaeon]